MRHRHHPNLAETLTAAFFARKRRVGDRFWSDRHIARRFRVSRYAAEVAVRELKRRGLLVRRHGSGTYVADLRRRRPRRAASAKPHLALVLPTWAVDPTNGFIAEFLGEFNRFAETHGGIVSVFVGEKQWRDAAFAQRVMATGCNALLTIDPPDEAALAFARFQEAGVACLIIGQAKAAAAFKIPSLRCNESETMRMLVLQLRTRGLHRIVLVGTLHSSEGKTRLAGCAAALEQFDHSQPADMLISGHDLDYEADSLRARLDSPSPPQAVIFQHTPGFMRALQRIPSLDRRMREGLVVAVFDDCYVDRQLPGLPFVELTASASEWSRKAVTLIESMMRGRSVPLVTTLQRKIIWPKPEPVLSG